MCSVHPRPPGDPSETIVWEISFDDQNTATIGELSKASVPAVISDTHVAFDLHTKEYEFHMSIDRTSGHISMSNAVFRVLYEGHCRRADVTERAF